MVIGFHVEIMPGSRLKSITNTEKKEISTLIRVWGGTNDL
jgi:hypothetical protein